MAGLTKIDLLKAAIKVEENGYKFYEEALEVAARFDFKYLFEELAQEELKHKEVFEKILKGLAPDEAEEDHPDLYKSFLDEVVKGHVFTYIDEFERKNRIAELRTKNMAIDYAIKFENDTIEFFEGLKKVISEDDRPLVDRLIIEEKSHVKKLVEQITL